MEKETLFEVYKEMRNLKNIWINLVSKFTEDNNLILKEFKAIEDNYQKSGRYYHNLNHIRKMLTDIKLCEIEPDDRDSVLFAIWFHDIIYNPKRNDNEEKSAEIAEIFLRKVNYNPEKTNKVKDMIIKSKNHQVEESDDFDTKLFLDLDLLILGADPWHYWDYVYDIRREYAFVPSKIFNLERSKLLSGLLKQKRLFKTKLLNEKYEIFARRNIQSELRLLSMQIEFIEWLETTKNKNDYYLIEKKLFEIAAKNGYKYVMKFGSQRPDLVLLIFRNKRNRRFISAFTSEEGFEQDELDHID